MLRAILLSILLLFSAVCQAENKSALGIDYLEITKNPIIAEVMLEMEPELIKYYQQGEWAGSTEADRVYALRHKAYILSQDYVSKDNYQLISEVAPEVPLKFLKLDKERYPNLWDFGELVRLKKEGKEERRLYKLLHGKEWGE